MDKQGEILEDDYPTFIRACYFILADMGRSGQIAAICRTIPDDNAGNATTTDYRLRMP